MQQMQPAEPLTHRDALASRHIQTTIFGIRVARELHFVDNLERHLLEDLPPLRNGLPPLACGIIR